MSRHMIPGYWTDPAVKKKRDKLMAKRRKR